MKKLGLIFAIIFFIISISLLSNGAGLVNGTLSPTTGSVNSTNAQFLGGLPASSYAKTNAASATNNGVMSINQWRTLQPKPFLDRATIIPPRMWGTWYRDGMNTTEAKVLEFLGVITNSGASRIYNMLEITEPPWDGFDSNGLYSIDEDKFPLHGMRPLEWIAGTIRSNGILPGIYIRVFGGVYPTLNGQNIYANATNLASMFDYCMIEGYTPGFSGSANSNQWEQIQEFIGAWESTGRPLVFMTSTDYPQAWHFSQSTILNITEQRTDSNGSWEGFQARLGTYLKYAHHVRPGHYLSLVPLSVVTGMESFQSYQSQMNFIALMSAPALGLSEWRTTIWSDARGTNNNVSPNFARTNLDLIEIANDVLARPARLVYSVSNDLTTADIFVKDLKTIDGDEKAVGFLNRSTNYSITMTCGLTNLWPDCTTNEVASVYDCAFRCWLGYVTNSISATVLPYGSQIYKVTRGKPAHWTVGKHYLGEWSRFGSWKPNATNAYSSSGNSAFPIKGWRWFGGDLNPMIEGQCKQANGAWSNSIAIRSGSGTNFYGHGFGVNPTNHVEWCVAGATRFIADFGYNGWVNGSGTGGGNVSLSIKVDGVEKFSQASMTVGDLAQINISLVGATTLAVDVIGTVANHMVFGDPRIEVLPTANVLASGFSIAGTNAAPTDTSVSVGFYVTNAIDGKRYWLHASPAP